MIENSDMKKIEIVSRNKTASEILIATSDLLDARGKDYDKPEGERSMQSIVAAFNAITGQKLTECEGWAFMACLKLVRAFSGDSMHHDSLDDLVAYSALLNEAGRKD